jgi:hypothetical protein
MPGTGADSTVATVTVNGSSYYVSPSSTSTDVPIPGVGTLHLNWTNTALGPVFPAPATSRALWLEARPGLPDVIVAEAQACDIITQWPCA